MGGDRFAADGVQLVEVGVVAGQLAGVVGQLTHPGDHLGEEGAFVDDRTVTAPMGAGRGGVGAERRGLDLLEPGDRTTQLLDFGVHLGQEPGVGLDLAGIDGDVGGDLWRGATATTIADQHGIYLLWKDVHGVQGPDGWPGCGLPAHDHDRSGRGDIVIDVGWNLVGSMIIVS